MSNSGIIHILGAAGTVTGSKYLIEANDKKIMVDCGLFQGLKELRLLNWNNLPVDVSAVDFVLLTHGHLDHVGYLPRLVKSGFNGKIYGTAPTLAIAEIVLKDTARIQEEEADYANKQGYSKHKPAQPLYGVRDAEQTLTHFSEIKTDEWIDFDGDIKVRFQANGHIIGSTFIEIHFAGKKFVFSGDVGRENDALMAPPKRPQEADILFVESTYGDRLHQPENIQEHLRKVIQDTVGKGGSVIIPSFAVERTQTLMYLIWQLKKSGKLPDLKFVMDSPMGANVLEVFQHYHEWTNLSAEDYSSMFSIFKIVSSFKETMALIDSPAPKVIIAGSGMVTGGRVLNYLQEYVGRPETTVLFVGYQAEGTRGRKLQDGTHEVKIYGRYYPVKAQIETIHGLSAHGDQKDMLNWLSEIKNKPEKIFVIHGEKQAAETLLVKIQDSYGWNCTVPSLYDIVKIQG
jgi:metallo-beta-lactamase family protein